VCDLTQLTAFVLAVVMCMTLVYMLTDQVLGDAELTRTATRAAFVALGLVVLAGLRTERVQEHFQLILHVTLFVVGIAKTVLIDEGGQFGQTLFQLLILLLLRVNFSNAVILSAVDLAAYCIYAAIKTDVNLRIYLSIHVFLLGFAISGCYRLQVRAQYKVGGGLRTGSRGRRKASLRSPKSNVSLGCLFVKLTAGNAGGLSPGQKTGDGAAQDASDA
jgi:hypothetical protein